MVNEVEAIPDIVMKIVKDASIWRCIQCGKCTASCPVGKVSRLRIRNMIYQADKGGDILPLEELWFCTTCYTCMERCPKGVNTVDAVLEFRREAVKKGNFPKLHETAIKNLYETGTGFPLSSDIVKYRVLLGLEKEPYDISTSDEELKAFKKLIDKLKLLSLIKR